MSLSAKSAIKTKSALRDRVKRFEAQEEILSYLEGCWEEELPGIEYETAEEVKMRRLCRWMTNRLDVMDRVGLAKPNTSKYDSGTYDDRPNRYILGSDNRYQARWRLSDYSEFVNAQLFPHSLLALGIDTPAKGNKFIDLYLNVYDSSRSWVSGCQVNQSRVADIATTQNYNRLPDWVKKGLMNAPDCARIGGDRTGDIWRLIPCAKAWKWAALPKRVAEKIGKCSPKTRMLTAIAWQAISSWNAEEQRHISRSEQVDCFYSNLAHLQKLPLLEQCKIAIESRVGWGKSRWAAFISASLGLPYGLFELPSDVNMKVIEEAIVTWGSPQQACKALFGASGKATVKAFLSCQNKGLWYWAQSLAYGNPDAVQKILALEKSVSFQADAVDFLKSLPMQSRIRLLGETTFKYRGQVNQISDDHVRDTGYLWSNIQQKPELGRVRCWFSVHEQLAAAFVKELPDEALSIPDGWAKVDGLCAVDGSWEIEIPQRVATLKYYGKILGNCVGGYGPAIKSGRSTIFVVREYGQITHCVEVCGKDVNQFYQANNQSADWELQQSVEKALQQARLIA